MLWKVWAAIGAVMCGILVASFPGGSVPPWAQLTLLVALLAGVATTVATMLSGGRSTWHEQRTARLEEDPGPSQNDREIVDRLRGALGERHLEWLRIESFAGPWRDDHAAQLRGLALVGTTHSGIFDPELRDAVGKLTDAASAFFWIYDGGTMADPMMRDATWRMIGRAGPDGETNVSTETDRIGTQARLRDAAAEICESYDAFLVISKHKFPLERPVGRPL